MKKLILVAAIITALSGCATNAEYVQYAKSMEAASVARSNALKDIANTGDSTAKVAAVMALALGSGGNNQISAPPPNEALQWASILVPSLSQGLIQAYGIRANANVAITQSNNATTAAIAQNNNALASTQSTNSAFVGLGQIIGNSGTNSSVSNANSVTAISNVATSGFVALTNIAASSNSTITSLQPTINNTSVNTLSGTGTLGSGAYSTSATDNHSVITPAPVVITPVITNMSEPITSGVK